MKKLIYGVPLEVCMQPHGDKSYFDISEYRRVLKYITKPDKDQRRRVLLVTVGGMLAIGVIMFAIYILMTFLPG
jgi:protein translocase SEC61 complex gamma subunit